MGKPSLQTIEPIDISWSWLSECTDDLPQSAPDHPHVYLYRLHGASQLTQVRDISQRLSPLLVVLEAGHSNLLQATLTAGATSCLFEDELDDASLTRHLQRCWAGWNVAARNNDEIEDMQSVIGTSPIMLHRWRPCKDTGIRFEYLAQNIVRFGYRSDELKRGGVNWFDLIHADDRTHAREQLCEQTLAGHSDYRLRYRILTKQGEYRWVEDTAQIKRNADGEVWYQGFITDVTERVANQQSLRDAISTAAASEQKLTTQLQEQQRLLDNIDLGILILDTGQRVVGSNTLAQSILGLDDEFIATRPGMADTIRYCFARGMYDFEESELDNHIRQREQMFSCNERQCSEIRRPDGRVYGFTVSPLDDGGRILTYYDITALKNAQLDLLGERRKLVANETKFRKLYTAANRNHKELQLLDKLQAAISNKLEVVDLYDTAVRSISDIFGYDNIQIHVNDGAGCDHFAGDADTPRSTDPITVDIIANVLETGKPLLQHTPLKSGDDSIGSTLGIPLRSGNHIPGVLIVESLTTALRQTDLLLMQKVAEQLSIALDNAELMATVSSDLQRTRAMSTLSRELNGAESIESLYDLIINNSMSIVDADAAAIYIVDPTEGYQLAVNSDDYREYPGTVDDSPVLRAIVSSEMTQAGTPVTGSAPRGYDISLCVPLHCQSEIWGVLELRRFCHRNTFSLADETLLLGIGNQLSAIAQKQALIAQVEHQAYHDSLTQLPNRRHFDRCLETGIANAAQQSTALCILSIDLDGFKSVNDTLGHPTGDQMLVTLADRLQQQTRPGDTLARMGGDEFAVILQGLPSPDAALAIAEQYLHLLNREVRIADHRLFVGASIGISSYPEDGTTTLELLQHADFAMYQAKSEGKNIARKFSPALAATAMARRQIEIDLNRAIETAQFELHYQPQVDCQSAEVLGVEALVRWHHPERGLVPPLEFIPIAEETGTILAIGEWVLRQACEQNARWLKQGYAPLRMAVNISALQFAHKDFVELVETTLADTGLPPELLELEVTESVVMHDINVVTAQLTRLQNLGVSIAIDDFGTGYSSLSYLQDLPLDSLKIDRAFINSLDCTAPEKSLANSIIMIAAAANLRTVAEGIESAEQIRVLAELGCSEAQGYLISKPQPAARIEQLLPRLPTKQAAAAA